MAQSKPIYDANSEQTLMTELWSPAIADDPREFVRFVYPWGKANTPLADLKGPRNWQDRELKAIADYIRSTRDKLQITGELAEMYRSAIASGRGIGKSATFAWLAQWMVSTRIGSSVWVAANGEPQLKTKTFPEIAKWVNMSINSHWFDVMATQIIPAQWLSELVKSDLKIDPKYWYVSAQLWSEENPDAFAGAHNAYGEMALFDEASGIPKAIWTVQQGVFTEMIVDRYWLGFSNARRNDGAFCECFHGSARDQWRRTQVNALEVEGIAKDAFHAIIKEHGEDSDEARVEVYGRFPNQAANQFIPTSYAQDAAARELPHPDTGAPLLLGVDVARGGSDYNVLAFRRGRDARSIPWQRFKGDTVQTATAVAEAAQRHGVDAIFVDGNGVGGGVVDMLKAWKYRVIEVQAGSRANDENKFKNKRAEMWGLAKEWLSIGCTPDEPDLVQDLCAPYYEYDPRTNQIVLESKEHMRDKRGVASPDRADALAMTFAQPVARNDRRTSQSHQRGQRVAKGMEYRMFD